MTELHKTGKVYVHKCQLLFEYYSVDRFKNAKCRKMGGTGGLYLTISPLSFF